MPALARSIPSTASARTKCSKKKKKYPLDYLRARIERRGKDAVGRPRPKNRTTAQRLCVRAEYAVLARAAGHQSRGRTSLSPADADPTPPSTTTRR